MTTVHAYTNDQRLADVAHKDLRRSRAAAENIIPTTTGAAKAVGKVLPALAGTHRRDGDAGARARRLDRGPDLPPPKRRPPPPRSTRPCAPPPTGPLARIIEYSEVPLVSSDIIGNPHSSIFDALSTQAEGDGYLKVVAWYDNEWGYSNRVVDLVERLAALGT